MRDRRNPPTEREARAQLHRLLAGDAADRAVARDLAETMEWSDVLLKLDVEDWLVRKGVSSGARVYTSDEYRGHGGGVITITTDDTLLGSIGEYPLRDEYDDGADDADEEFNAAQDFTPEQRARRLGHQHDRAFHISRVRKLTSSFKAFLAERGLYFERRATPATRQPHERAMTWTIHIYRKSATSAERIAERGGHGGLPIKKGNPGVDQAAKDAYESFHRYPPKKIGQFEPGFAIPTHVFKQGDAIDVLYRSSKVDPETLLKPRKPVDYIHEHDPGVSTYLVEGAGEKVEMPKWIREIESLVLLGKCLGFKFKGPDGKVVDAQGRAPLPELYTTVNGKCLVVVDGKRTPIAFIWGGRLDVEPRGIVH